MSVLTRREWITLCLIVLYSSVPAVGGLLRVAELIDGPALLPANPRAITDPWPIVLHVLGSVLFCIAGALQFLPSLRRRRPALHRVIGRVTVLGGWLSAGSGLWMTVNFAFPEALQGSLLFSARIVLGIAMLGLLGWAVVAVRAGRFRDHAAAMMRAYAIGQGASTQAFLGLAWIALFAAEPAGLLRDGFMVLCWGLNLAAAEALIRLFVANARPTAQVRHEARARLSMRERRSEP